jgi:hypothetical protein
MKTGFAIINLLLLITDLAAELLICCEAQG